MNFPETVMLPDVKLTVDADLILNSLPDPILVVGGENQILAVNSPAEFFFATGASILRRQTLMDLVPFDSPLAALVAQVREKGYSITEYDVLIETPKTGRRAVDIQVSRLMDRADCVLITLQERSIADKIDRQLTHRSAARSVTGMAAVMAHEIKNPLSGIRGAAQLIEANVGPEDKTLTRLICDEADRICALVDSMEAFSDRHPLDNQPVNIHQVLEHVRKLSQSGFGRNVRFKEVYDPSLPPVKGDRNQLIQVFLNLVKNAVEATEGTGEILMTTAFRHGVRLSLPGSRKKIHLPLEVCIIDNGPGVPDDLKEHLFDPFVTTKATGTGLGLALVAKIIGDHGGVIECEATPGRTIFRAMLPAFTELGDAPKAPATVRA